MQTGGNNIRENGFVVLSLLLYVALSLTKMQAYLPDGRFWAEEGCRFYPHIALLPAFEKFFFVFNGHLELVANIITAGATMADFKYAPLVTTYSSFALQTIPVFLIVWMHRSLGIRGWLLPILVLIIVGLPQSPEVWANTANLQFHFSLLAALIAVLPVRTGIGKHAFRLLLLLSGLSGIPANFVAPAFLYLAANNGDRERWIQFSILAATSLLQLAIIATHGFDTGDRSLTANPLLYWLPVISQQVVGPLLGPDIGEPFALILRDALAQRSGAIFLGIICSIPFFYIVRREINAGTDTSRTAVICAALLSVLGTAAALGDKTELISTTFSGRYFFASNVLLTVYALSRFNRNIFYLGAVLMLLISSMHNVDQYLGGPDWRTEYERAQDARSKTVNIWPYGWEMPNFALGPTPSDARSPCRSGRPASAPSGAFQPK